MCIEIHSDTLIVSAESIRNNWIFLRLWIKTVSVTVKLLCKKNSIENNEFISYSYWETFFFFFFFFLLLNILVTTSLYDEYVKSTMRSSLIRVSSSSTGFSKNYLNKPEKSSLVSGNWPAENVLSHPPA